MRKSTLKKREIEQIGFKVYRTRLEYKSPTVVLTMASDTPRLPGELGSLRSIIQKREDFLAMSLFMGISATNGDISV